MPFTIEELREISGVGGWVAVSMFCGYCILQFARWLGPHISSLIERVKDMLDKQGEMCDRFSENSDRHTSCLEQIASAVSQHGDLLKSYGETQKSHGTWLADIHSVVFGGKDDTQKHPGQNPQH